MVFEFVAAELLNRLLADFVDNVDSSQLNLGLWGGNVTLQNLLIKNSVLDDFELSIKLKFGFISRLELHVPWKNLYTEPFIATVEGLYVIVVPSKGVMYNEERALRIKQHMKQKALLRLDEQLKKLRKPQSAMADSFTEKLLAQVIKNLQVNIRNVHVRYEDNFTNPVRPFEVGATLETLEMKTMEERSPKSATKKEVQIVRKLIVMRNLAVYWNELSTLISDLTDQNEIKCLMQTGMAMNGGKCSGYKYVLEPTTAEMKLLLNRKPEADETNWQTPKLDFSLQMQTLVLRISKTQYQDLLLFLEAQERFGLAAKYSKYRPSLDQYHGHYKQWWHFAYKSILEEIVRRRRNNWSWVRMKAHRQLVKRYKEAWLNKQTETNLGEEDKVILKKAEEELDVFNLNVARQLADIEIVRRGLTRLKDQPHRRLSWVQTWLGGAEQKKSLVDTVKSNLKEAMIAKEKAKLFEAIDYQENAPPTNYPKHFIENVVRAQLNSLMIIIDDALSMNLFSFTAKLQQRPSAKAINIETAIKSVAMSDHCGHPVLTMMDESTQLLTLYVDVDPLGRESTNYDLLVKLNIEPTILKYHAIVISSLVDTFTPPQTVKLNRLRAAAFCHYEEVKKHSISRLAEAIKAKTKLAVDIVISPMTIVISEGGVFRADALTFVTELGPLSLTTAGNDSDESDSSSSEHEINEANRLSVLMSSAYDKFALEVTDIHIILADNFNAAMSARRDAKSELHIIEPTDVQINFHKSSIDDQKLPQMRIFGDLPNISLTISNERLLKFLKLLLSIPRPSAMENDVSDGGESHIDPLHIGMRDRAKAYAIMNTEKLDDDIMKTPETGESLSDREPNDQRVLLEMDLRLSEVRLAINSTRTETLMRMQMTRIGCKLRMCRLDALAMVTLGNFTIEHPQYRSLVANRETLFVVDNLNDDGENLLQLKFIQADRKNRLFSSDFNCTEQALTITLKPINICLHQEAVMDLKVFCESIRKQVIEIGNKKLQQTAALSQDGTALNRTVKEECEKPGCALNGQDESSTPDSEEKGTDRQQQAEKKLTGNDRTVKLSFDASFDALSVLIGSSKSLETTLSITTITASIEVGRKQMRICAGLRAVTMQDCGDTAKHDNLLTVGDGSEDFFTLEVIQYQRSEERTLTGVADADVALKGRLKRIHFVFLRAWLLRLLNWVEPLQAEAESSVEEEGASMLEKANKADGLQHTTESSLVRVQLDVRLADVTIIIPKKSNSTEALVFDLDKLSVSNTFSNQRVKPDTTTDTIVVVVSNISFAVGRLSGRSADMVTSRCRVLEPLSFSLFLIRELSCSSCKRDPEYLFETRLPKIQLRMSKEDYTTILGTLSGNLADGASEKVATPSRASAARREGSTDTGPTGTVSKKAQRFEFRLELEGVIVSLYLEGCNLDARHGVVPRETSATFALVDIRSLKMGGHITESGYQKMSIAIHTAFVGDERKVANVKEVFNKKDDECSLIDFCIEQTPSGNITVNLTSSSFCIHISPSFVLQLTNFFRIPNINDNEASSPNRMDTSVKASETVALSDATGKLTAQWKVGEVEIVAVEDACGTLNARALLLLFRSHLSVMHKDGKQYVDVVIKDLQLLSTYLASSKRKEWKYEVLKKVAINFNGAINNADKSNSFKLVIDTVLLKFSPVVVGLACAMSAHFASLKGREDAKAQERPQLLKSSSHYWMKEKVDRDKHWWFNVSNVPQEEFEAVSARTALPDRREEVTINVKSFSLVLETGQKFFTAPVFLVESSFSGVASNWSSLLSADAVLTLQASYFNEMLSAWEPLVEPVEIAEGHWKSWTMGLMVRSHSDEELVASRGAHPQGKHSLTIQADCPLEITLTKSLLRLLVDLVDSLDKAMNGIAPPAESALICSAQYVVRNESGMPLQIVNSSTLELESKQTLAVVNDACYIGLYVPSAAQKPIGINTSCNGEAVRLRLNLKHNSTEKEVNVARAEIQTICLQHPTETDHEWKMVVETKVEDTRHIIILRSILQFENHMSIPIEVYSASDGNFKLCSTIMPSERPVSIPLMSLCDSDCKLKLKPAKAGYDLSKESVCWLKFVDKERYVLRCKSTSEATEMLYVVLVIEETAAKPYNVTEFNDKVYLVHICSPVTVQNLLPFPVKVTSPVEHDLASSEQINLNTASGTRIKFEICYRGDIYSSSNIRFSSKPQNFEVVKFCSKKKKLNLGMRWITEREQMKAQIFASYWFVNNTGKTLKYMEGGIKRKSVSLILCRRREASHEAAAITQKPFTEPVLLPLSSRGFFNKKKAKVKIEESQWSNEFTLAAVGTTIRIKCKAADRDYEMSLDVYLSQSGLTKVVCFSPFFLIHNLSPLGVEIGQSGYDEWVKVEPQSCLGLWPHQAKEQRFLLVRYANTEQHSIMFPFTENFEGFCQIDNEYLGVYVTCCFGASSWIIRLEPFEAGMAPALVMNCTKERVRFSQKGSTAIRQLEPWECCMFTWSDVTQNRELEWQSGVHCHMDALLSNSFGIYKASPSSRSQYYWVSFLDGRQRVVLFTDDLAVATMAQQAYEVEFMTHEVMISLRSIGISLVNNAKAEELLYIAIIPAPVIWEQLDKSGFKLLTVKQMGAIERAYNEWQRNPNDSVVTVDETEVDFNRMQMKNKKGERTIRRHHQPGLWFQYGQSAHQKQLHFKLSRLQVDNQLANCVFPTIVAVVPPPKSIVADNVPKPFAEFSVAICQSEHSSLVQVKYLHLLIQEFAVRIDEGIINTLVTFLGSEVQPHSYNRDAFEKDLAMTTHSYVSQVASNTRVAEQKAFYDDLHISPLMVHVSFSKGGTSEEKSKMTKGIYIQSEFINVILNSIGITLTEVDDAVFKLGFFERRCVFYSHQQLQNEILSHYLKQAIKQLHVLIFGLDVIGNPYGLVRDLSSGVQDFFYQPYKGAIKGPEEFAGGVRQGVRGLFGATVGGASGAVSRITGTLGKGLATLACDEEYARRRQRMFNERSRGISGTVACGAEGVGRGFCEGVAGIVAKPIEGARTGGVGGFARGVGKGVIGAAVRPVSGVVDFASCSFGALKTAAIGAEEVQQLRPPRVILIDKIIRPYSAEQSLGAKIFREAQCGSSTRTDHFIAHKRLSSTSAVIITDKAAVLLKRVAGGSYWRMQWRLVFSEMKPPEVCSKRLYLKRKKERRGFLRRRSPEGRMLQFDSERDAHEVAEKITSAYNAELQR